MNPLLRHLWALRRRGAILALMVAAWLVLGPRPAVASAGHSCKCEAVCTGHCCCTRQAAPAPTLPTTPTEARGPCVCDAPCGGPGAPDAPTGSPVAKLKALGACSLSLAPTSGHLLPAAAARLHPARVASRLDDPPEPTAGL